MLWLFDELHLRVMLLGLADVNALPLAVSTYQACHFIGLPECAVRVFKSLSAHRLTPHTHGIQLTRLVPMLRVFLVVTAC